MRGDILSLDVGTTAFKLGIFQPFARQKSRSFALLRR